MRLDLRRRLLASVIGAVALTMVVLIVVFNLVLGQRLSHDADNTLYARASAELASLRVSGHRLNSPELPDAGALDAQSWVFAGDRLIEQPHSDAATERAVRSLDRGPRRVKDIPGSHIRLYAVPVVAAGQRLGTVVAEVSLRPYESTAQTALVASAVLGLVVLVLVAIASRFLISGALAPVAAMTRQASEWSETDAPLRFGLGPPRDELTQLAATLDALLDRIATSLRHEQRFSAELSHELRTPLASVIAEAQFALRHSHSSEQYREGYRRLLASAQQMSRTLDALLAAARAEHHGNHGVGDARSAAQAAVLSHAALAADRGLTLDCDAPPRPIAIGVESEVAERILAPLIENGCRWAQTGVSVAIERRGGSVVFCVQDDGPGVREAEPDRIFQPGWKGEHASASGIGLGLPLARRLARAAGGDVTVERPEGPGGRFSVRLPAA